MPFYCWYLAGLFTPLAISLLPVVIWVMFFPVVFVHDVIAAKRRNGRVGER